MSDCTCNECHCGSPTKELSVEEWHKEYLKLAGYAIAILSDCEKLSQENAKLRELVRDLYEMAYPECPSAFEMSFADRMRDLGVEVDA